MKQILSNMMWLLLIVATTSCIMEDQPSEWSLQPGESLPEFSVTTLSGVKVSRSDFEGEEGYIIFFTTSCGDCQRELPRMEEFYRRMEGEEGVEFICISRGEGEDKVRDYWEKEGFTMPVAAVEDRSVYEKFASSGVPRLYVSDDCIITAVYSERLPD